MEVDADGRRRVRNTPVVKGSVWETRMRVDQVKGGIKVFGLDEDDVSVVPVRTEPQENEAQEKNTTPVKAGRSRTRKTWKAESFDAPIQILNEKPEETERIPVQVMKPKSDGNHQKVILGRSSDVGQLKFGTRVSLGHDDDSDGDNEEFFDIKEMNKPKLKPFPPEEKKSNRKITPLVKIQQQPPLKLQTTDRTAKLTKMSSSEKKDIPRKQSRVQNIYDLIMWRDIEKSAMVFTFGASIIICSTLVTDPSTSFITAISYLGLASLAAIFLYRSIIWRGYVDSDDDNTLKEVGEAEVLSMVRLLLPYFNGFIRELKALLSGDPATTMKISVLLFVLARWGSYITMWNIVKFGFLGVFSVPKLWSLYRHQFTEYGKMGAKSVGDAWESLPHKKAIGTAIAVLVLVFSSTVGRIWTVFMLFAASRFHQQCLVRDVNRAAAKEKKWQS